MFCICENKDADQLRGNREADQRLCFRYTDSTIPLLSKSEISSLLSSSVAVQPGLCRTWSETPKTGFLRTRLILFVLLLKTNLFSFKRFIFAIFARKNNSAKKSPHSPVLQSAKINRRENAHEDKNSNIKSRENELVSIIRNFKHLAIFLGPIDRFLLNEIHLFE